MSKVTRYTDCEMYGMAAVAGGEFVTFDDYQALRAELEAMRGRLGSLGGHNLKQGMMLAQMGVEPEDLAKVSINKIKADAILSVLDTPEDCETPTGDIAWSSESIQLIAQFHLEQGQ